MKFELKALRLFIVLSYLVIVSIAVSAQSPFSVETTKIDATVSQTENEGADTASDELDKIGWVRNDMGDKNGQFVVITRSTVNVRSGPGTGFSILQTSGRGEKYPLIREESGWYAMKIGTIDFESMAQAWLRNDMAVRVKKVISVIKDKVNLRSGPSTSHSIVGETMVGRTYPLIDTKNNWYRIALVSAEPFIPLSDPQELQAAQNDFTSAYGDYTRLVQEKGRSHSETQAALNRFRASYGVYSILAKGSQALKDVRATGQVDKIVIDKRNFTSTLYSNGKVVRIYPIAYGANPDAANKKSVGDKRTPEGAFEIINRAKNPTYKNIPGGAKNNPLGTRWMGLNTWKGSIGMHGTSAPSSIGSRASAGCVRMFTPDAEELFDMVRVSLPVIITSVKGYQQPEEPATRQEEKNEPQITEEPADEEPANEPETERVSPPERSAPESSSPKEPEKPKSFWDRISSFFGNLFS
jgi:lipoprotein-anchoring transpeptidase ErfK/SrfK